MKKNYQLLLTFIIMLASMSMTAQTYFTDYGTYGRSDAARKLNSLTFQRNSNTIATLAVNQGTTQNVSPIYFDKTTQIIDVKPGDALTINYNWAGAWMHNIVYVDWNKDGTFATDGSSERIGYNAASGSGSEVGKPVTYTIPATQATGQYRMRIMIDWLNETTYQSGNANAHPDTEINTNGGVVVDVILNVTNLYAPVLTSSQGVIVKNDVITITSETGTTIKYTTDGTDPVASSTATEVAANTANVTLTADATVKAVALQGTTPSTVASVAYKTIDLTLGNYYGVIFQHNTASLALTDNGDGSTITVTTFVANTDAQQWKLAKGSASGLYTLTSKTNHIAYYDAAAQRFKTATIPGAEKDMRILTSGNTTYPGSFEIQRTASTSRAMNMFGGATVNAQIGEWNHNDNGNALKFSTNKTTLKTAIDKAQAIYDNTANTGTDVGQHAQADKNTLNTAITNANSVYNSSSATETQINDATTAMNNAIAAFNASAVNMPVASTIGTSETLYVFYTPNRSNSTLADVTAGSNLKSNTYTTVPTTFPNTQVWSFVSLGDGTYALVNPFSKNYVQNTSTAESSGYLSATATPYTSGGWKLDKASVAPLMIVYSPAQYNGQMNFDPADNHDVYNWGYNQSNWGGVLNGENFVINDNGGSMRIIKVGERTAKATDPATDVPSGTIAAGTTITLTSAKATDNIYYTIDGTDPLTSSTRSVITGTPAGAPKAQKVKATSGSFTAPSNNFTLKAYVAETQSQFNSNVISVPYSIVTGLNAANTSHYIVKVKNGMITVDGVSEFEVYSVAGQKVNAKQALQNGMYVVKVKDFTQKVIIK